MKNTKIIILVVAIAMILGLQALAEMVPEPYPTYNPEIFAKDTSMPLSLKSAGFTNVKEFDVNQSATYYPNYYFSVNQIIDSAYAAQWGKAANTVSVFLRKMPINWVYNNGQVQEENIAGRYQARASGEMLYVVVTGPDKDIVAKLANWMTNPPSVPNQ